MRKAQGMVEVLLFIVLGLIIVVAAVLLVSNSVGPLQSGTAITQHRAALDDLAAAGTQLSAQGTGARRQVIIMMGDDAQDITFDGGRMVLRTRSGTSVDRAVPFNALGFVNVSGGNNFITAEALEKGICFGDKNLCALCGDGIIEGVEQCEGSDLNGNTCVSLGYARGNLSCNALCRFDTFQCVPPVCGNNIAETGEICDGTDLAGHTCQTEGSWTGMLSCLPGCMGFNLSQCVPAQSTCLAINITQVTLDAADNRIHGIEVENLCPYEIFVTGANISWTSPTLLETVQIDGSVKWSFNCNWDCSPIGRQPSGTPVYFSGTNTLLYTVPALSMSTFDKVDWKDSIENVPITLRFILNDSSLNASVPFTVTN